MTLLGWTINGPLGRNGSAKRTSNFIRADTALDQQFQRFCNIKFNDSLLDNERAMSLEDKRVLNIMESTAVLKEGHYEIAMPWRYSPLCLPNNRILAAHRLELLQRRLVKDPLLFQKYLAFVDNLLDKAYARKVPDNQLCRSGEATWSRTTQCFIQRNPGKLEWCSTVQRRIRGVSERCAVAKPRYDQYPDWCFDSFSTRAKCYHRRYRVYVLPGPCSSRRF